MLFSQRQGFKPAKQTIQFEGMDADLRNSLWNALEQYYWHNFAALQYRIAWEIPVLIIKLWRDLFKQPIDTIPHPWHGIIEILRDYFFKAQWYGVYDFVEFIASSEDTQRNKAFVEYCNVTLERELSGYRFVGGRIVPVTNKMEIAEVEQALAASEPLAAGHYPSASGVRLAFR